VAVGQRWGILYFRLFLQAKFYKRVYSSKNFRHIQEILSEQLQAAKEGFILTPSRLGATIRHYKNFEEFWEFLFILGAFPVTFALN
jgi:hypothetical protein